MQSIVRAVLSTAVLLLSFSVPAEAQEESCVAALYKAASKYQSCELRAQVGGFDSFDSPAFLKCRQKYAATWTKLGLKYPGTSCAGARFVDNGTTISDNLTRLEWEKKTTAPLSGENYADPHDVDNVYTWSSAGTSADGTVFTDFLDSLNGSGFAGQHDWRLPTPSELGSILSTDAIPCAAAPCVVDPLFASVASGGFSSMTYAGLSTYVWSVSFLFGYTDIGVKAGAAPALAVRGGL